MTFGFGGNRDFLTSDVCFVGLTYYLKGCFRVFLTIYLLVNFKSVSSRLNLVICYRASDSDV